MAEHSKQSRGGAGRPDARPKGMVVASVVFRAGLALAALAVAVGVFMVLLSSRRQIERDESAAAAPPIVTAVVARERSVAREWRGYGTARSMGVAEVSAEVGGRVVERPGSVEPGARVERGDVLVRLDDVVYAQRVEAARQAIAGLEADLEGLAREEARLGEQAELAAGERDAAQRDYDRVRQAVERGAGTAGEVDRFLSALRGAERALSAIRQQLDLVPSRRASLEARLAGERASLRIAEEDLADATIRAPIGGTLQSVGPDVGDRLNVGSPVARVVDLSRVEVPVRLPVSAARSVIVGDAVRLGSDSAAGSSWAGEVARLAPEADAGSRTITAFVVVEQDAGAPGVLLPGQFVVASVRGEPGEPLVVVPRRAVEGDRVMTAVPEPEDAEAGSRRASVVTPRAVRVAFYASGRFPEIDPEETEWAVLEAGSIEPGSVVIVSNLEQLRAGMIVEARELAGGSGGGGPAADAAGGAGGGGG